MFLALTAAGACADFTLALALADAVNGLMMLPNLAGLFALSGEVARRTPALSGRKAHRPMDAKNRLPFGRSPTRRRDVMDLDLCRW